ncbi:putative UDP-glucuronate decarboxylase [Helianthus annuus]|nr:putative UDP-glucuronate decarboxylase [Helianthus annuus]KAJ0509976.1 putative UDP-glucuronate decarboxylase [Helianthus annuus]KAJ0517947.1 putative UDP-glucuronate decarboxylase [Helianthus annuus]KAJ0685967.1 putative UDP-glucuronate decarboxylase [Helianthus annuus]KAJ0689828.1 putative UDP-glucuronate decarboxylase [Helianthus annuus]
MGSELIYRGHEPQTTSDSYSPKPNKPWLSVIRPIRYLLREQRLLFILIGIFIGAAVIAVIPSSTTTNRQITYSDAYSISQTTELLNPKRPVYRFGPLNSGGKIPLGLKRKGLRIVVTGGAGFVGSHLVDRLIARGDSVIVVDNFFTGNKDNVMHHFGNPRFELIRHDVVEPLLLEVDQIYHLACPASPVHYKHNPVKTITNVVGTLNMLGLAKRVGARFLLTSTSEVYGDPLQHPQVETYWGNVNPIGVRSCYDEGKRTAETLAMDYHRGAGVEVRIARIFNTYGPRMCIDDGRVVSNFVAQALRKEPLTVYGDGKQTRSFQFVSDLVEGLMRLMEGEHVGPFNLGNPGEFTMLELAQVVQETIDPNAKIEFRPNTEDDPHKRKPDITKAKDLLGWEPKVPLRKGLPMMVSDFRQRIFGDHKDNGATSTATSV